MAEVSAADVEKRAQELAKMAGEIWDNDPKRQSGGPLREAGRDHYRTLARKQLEQGGDA